MWSAVLRIRDCLPGVWAHREEHGRAAGNGACAGQAASRLEAVGEACRPVRRPEDVLPKLVSPGYEFASRIAFATAEYFRGTIAILCRLV